LAGYEKLKDDFEQESISVLGASVDDREKSERVQADLSFPIAYGLTKGQVDCVGAWWDQRRGFVQPSEFILDNKGIVLSATYSTGPVGRLDAADALSLVKILKARSKNP
jgi:peroxiredoxin